MNRNFKYNWFDGNIGVFDHFLKNFKGVENLTFLEIGSFEGRSSCWLLDNILTAESSKLTCIDSWDGGEEHQDIKMSDIEKTFLTNTESNKHKIEILKGISEDCLLKIQDRKNHYDFIYIDGGHIVKDVLIDSILSFNLLKSGGIMAFDDYLWGGPSDTGNQKDLHMRPQVAIDVFLLGWQSHIDLLHRGGQVWIKKK